MGNLKTWHGSLRHILAFGLIAFASQSWANQPRQTQTSRKIEQAVARVVANENIPGMIAAIGDAQGVIAIGSAGVRKTGSSVPITDHDLVHIGSCTKAMTCALLATLVADGTLSWNTKLIQVFPELKGDLHTQYHNVTLWQLVTHRAGLPANASDWWVHRNKDITARRLAIMKDNLKGAPTGSVGKYLYSNLGYMVAGCMAERLTRSTWEALINERLFRPLGMRTAGFGPPGTKAKVDQPWGHNRSNGNWQARQFDNAVALGPAGRVHCTLADWAKFTALQLPQNQSRLLSQQSLDKLIEPVGEYAGGWIVVRRSWAQGEAQTHSGSNTMWYATVWVAPKLNRTFMVATNSSDKNSHALCDKMIAELIEINRQANRR